MEGALQNKSNTHIFNLLESRKKTYLRGSKLGFFSETHLCPMEPCSTYLLVLRHTLCFIQVLLLSTLTPEVLIPCCKSALSSYYSLDFKRTTTLQTTHGVFFICLNQNWTPFSGRLKTLINILQGCA